MVFSLIDGMALPHCAKGAATVTATEGLNVHVDNLLASAVVGLLAFGETVTIWCVDTTGLAIVQNGRGLTGWASMTYLRPIGKLLA